MVLIVLVMKNVKRLFLAMLLSACALSISSCQKEEPVRLFEAIVTVKVSEDMSSVVFQITDDRVVYPVNIKPADMGPDEFRALIRYRKPTSEELLPGPNQEDMIYVDYLSKILTKDLAPDFGPEGNEEAYRKDPVEIVNDWATIAEDGYLNLRFRTYWGDGGPTHLVNLVYTPEEDNPYCVTFYHNENGDVHNYESDGIVAFRLSGLPDTNGQTVDLLLKWESFTGPKQALFKYKSR